MNNGIGGGNVGYSPWSFFFFSVDTKRLSAKTWLHGIICFTDNAIFMRKDVAHVKVSIDRVFIQTGFLIPKGFYC